MDLKLEGRTALVTGSSHGIGRAIALCFAKEGANVAICSRNYDELLALEEKIVEEHNVVVGSYKVDATDPKSIEEMFNLIPRDFAGIDILINTVGGTEKFGSFNDLSDEDWEHAWRLNFMSAKYFCEKTTPWLKRSKSGRIINISSLSGISPGLFNPHYAAAKAALISLTKSLANELAQYSILVNSICPSTVLGHGFNRNVQDRAQRANISIDEARELMLAEEEKKTPLGKLGTEEDVALLAVFLASPLNHYITGQCIVIDGGIRRSVL